MRERLIQGAVYAAAEAQRLTLAERLQRRSDQSTFKRLGKAAAGNIFKALLDVPTSIDRNGEQFRLLSHGFENLVYANELEVVKVNIRTLTSNSSTATAALVKHKNEFELCKPYLDDYWPATTFHAASFMDGYAVEARQPFITTNKIFTGIEEMLNYRDDPQYVQQLENLFFAIGNVYQNTGFYPDILGPGNLALAESIFGDPRFVILDTGVASTEHQEHNVPNQDIKIKDAISQQLGLWEAAPARLRQLSGSR